MKEKRKELGYTLKDIANKMNVTEATVQRGYRKHGISIQGDCGG